MNTSVRLIIALAGAMATAAASRSETNLIPILTPVAYVPATDSVHLAVSEPYAYVSRGTNGFQVFDISDISNPKPKTEIDPGENIATIALDGRYAYAGCGYRNPTQQDGIRVYDVADPQNPVWLGFYSTGGIVVQEMLPRGDILYAAIESGLYIYDVSDKADIKELSHFVKSGTGFGLTIRGNYLYFGHGGDGLRIFDISDPANPIPVGQGKLAAPRGVAVSGDYAFVATSIGGLAVYNIVDPANPFRVAYTYNTTWGMKLALWNHYAVVAAWDDGVWMYDILNPEHPVQAAHVKDGRPSITKLTVSGDYLFAPSDLDGWRIYKMTMGPPPRLGIAPADSGYATVSWTPNTTQFKLQTRPNSDPTQPWADLTAGTTNHVLVPVTENASFYQLLAK